MKFPNLNEEKKLWKKGFKVVAGLDEAGRGPLAGPVVAAAVVVDFNAKIFDKNFGVRDSKKLSKKQREKFYKILTNHPQIEWGIGIVSEKVIDKINILEATKLAMKKAVKKLNPDFLLLDGNFKIHCACLPAGRRQKPIVKGDAKVFSISA
ncbi:MAG: ribonuclease HII, partial [Candidatus Staskawiczbacteria bacterium]|nr:ribonuclease HII [Candidatus Staskawiczbacteria bacterium]